MRSRFFDNCLLQFHVIEFSYFHYFFNLQFLLIFHSCLMHIQNLSGDRVCMKLYLTMSSKHSPSLYSSINIFMCSKIFCTESHFLKSNAKNQGVKTFYQIWLYHRFRWKSGLWVKFALKSVFRNWKKVKIFHLIYLLF